MDKQQATQTLHGLIEVGGPWLRTLPVRVFKALLEAGAEIEEENERGETMLYAAISHHAPDKMLKFLLKAGAATEREVHLDSPDYIGSSIMYALNAQGNDKVTYTHVTKSFEKVT